MRSMLHIAMLTTAAVTTLTLAAPPALAQSPAGFSDPFPPSRVDPFAAHRTPISRFSGPRRVGVSFGHSFGHGFAHPFAHGFGRGFGHGFGHGVGFGHGFVTHQFATPHGAVHFPFTFGTLGGGLHAGASYFQPGTYQGPVLVGSVNRIDPALLGEQVETGAAPAEPTPIPLRQALTTRMEEGEYEEATRIWRLAEMGRQVEEERTFRDACGKPYVERFVVRTDEVWSMDRRLLAVAIAGEGDLPVAAREMTDAYLINPDLAYEPLDGDSLARNGRALRRLVVDAITHAQRTPSSDAWFLAAILTQAEGRDRIAAKFITRAEKHGLDREVATACYEAMGGRPAPERDRAANG